MTLNGSTLVNPVQVISDTEPVSAHNTAYAGVVTYDHTLLDARMYVHILQVQWAGLTKTELEAIRAEWQAATEAYVALTLDGLSIISQGAVDDDDANVCVLEDTGFEVTFDQGWTADGSGPLVYNATATFVTEPQADS